MKRLLTPLLLLSPPAATTQTVSGYSTFEGRNSFFFKPTQVHSDIECGASLSGTRSKLNIRLDDNSTK